VAQAVGGDTTVLASALAAVQRRDDPAFLRLEPALVRLALEAGILREGDENPRQVLWNGAVSRLILGTFLADVGRRFGEEGISWMPIKGMDTGGRFFDQPEDRPTSDLDVLIRLEDVARARNVLEAAGWHSAQHGRRYEAFLENEAYNWQATNEHGVLLELHFRFWGLVGASFVDDVWERARPDESLGPTAFRMPAPHAFVVSALHYWLEAPPRPMLYEWELSRIVRSDGDDVVSDVVDVAQRQGVQLPVGLVAARTAALWDEPRCRHIASGLLRDLGSAERAVARRAFSRGLNEIGTGRMYLARLLARRPCRMGWKAILRRVWAHPAIVEMNTDEGHAWTARRLRHVAVRLGLNSSFRASRFP